MKVCEIPQQRLKQNRDSREISLRINGGSCRAFPERNNCNTAHHHDSSKRLSYGRSRDEVGV